METLKDVLLYLARHVPAGMNELAAMEQVIERELGAPPAPPAPAPGPAAPSPRPAGQPGQPG
jgi:hypothetical protein